METLEFRFRDKASWGDGPWQSEPDKKQWTDPATGLPCLIVRGPVGALCGYVAVKESHPLFGKGDSDDGLDVHGGITFSDHCAEGDPEHGICHRPGSGEPDHVWWLGFDCSHGFDHCPDMAARYRSYGAQTPIHSGEVYRDQVYVEGQCAKLALQLAEMGGANG